MIVLVYVAAYSFYNLDHRNILWSLVPWNQGIFHKDMIVRFLYAAAALLAAAGAVLLTLATAYRPPNTNKARTTFSTAGPFRYVRDPHSLANFLLILALGPFQSIFREELLLEREYGEHFRS
jgi:protein-S-isoprenylcysteine O-methyltransferase Ste14